MVNIYSSSNASHPASTGWEPEPQRRGTYNILSTCLVTISLCVWTALHLNIPAHKKVKWQWWRKLKWLIVGLFAPEVVAWTAYCQYRAASDLTMEMRKCLKQTLPLSWYRRVVTKLKCSKRVVQLKYDLSEGGDNWSLTHSHYVLMGGFAIVPGEPSPSGPWIYKFTQAYPDRFALTSKGVAFLASLNINLLPSLSKSDIMDKSKASGLTKALVCIQALWFCLQFAVRLEQGLKVSLLELNTFAHGLCALLIFLLWWEKPLDVDEPTTIQGTESTLPAIALLCLASSQGRNWKSPQNYDVTIRPTFGRDPHSFISQGDMTGAATRSGYCTHLVLGKELHGFCINSFRIPECGDGPTDMTDRQAQNPLYDPIHVGLDHGQVRGLELASQAINRYNITTWKFSPDLLVKTIPNRPNLNPFRNTDAKETLGFFIGFTFAGVLYGGLHLSAWNAPFPTATQQLLWRISGLALISSGPALAIQLLGEALGEKYYNRLFGHSCGIWECFGCCGIAMPWYLTIGTAYFLYGLARVYLVVECFVMLWHLPDEAYLVPRWTQYLPHVI